MIDTAQQGHATRPAPIDPERLAPALEPFGHSHALPSEAYTSTELFEWELEHFFDASWLCLGRAGALSSAAIRGPVW